MLGAGPLAIERDTSPQVVCMLDAHRMLLEHSLRDRLLDEPITASGPHLERYLVATLGDCRTERLRALFLDAGNRLISDDLIAHGDPSSTPATPRQILNRALDLQAVGLILIHNHPGGQTTPSLSDITFTRKVAEAGKHLGIVVHDHIIVAGNKCASLRVQGVI